MLTCWYKLVRAVQHVHQCYLTPGPGALSADAVNAELVRSLLCHFHIFFRIPSSSSCILNLISL